MPRPPVAAPAPDPDDRSHAEEEIASYVARAQSRNLDGLPALSAFQRRMEQYPQLSADAQSELAADVRECELAKQRMAAEKLGKVEQRRLLAKIRKGEAAVDYLVASNFRLVLLIARENAEDRYGRERASEILPDLVAEANLALVEAVRTFDPGRGPLFSTYAARVVRDRVRMVLTKESSMRLPPSWVRVKRIASVRIPTLAAELGRQPTREEIQADLIERCKEWAASKLTEEQRTLPAPQREAAMMAKLRKQGMLGAIDNLDDVLMATQSIASLDSPVGDDGSASLGDLVMASGADDSLFDDVELTQLRESLQAALAPLSDRDRQIILYRFGFVDGERWTYAMIAQQYNVTAERIRQIEKNVIARLASPGASRDALQSFLPGQYGDQ